MEPSPIAVSVPTVFRAHCTIIALLLAMHLSMIAVTHLTSHQGLYGFASLVDLNQEQSIPNFFSGAALLATAIASAFVLQGSRRRGDGVTGGWVLITAILLFLAFDEGAGIHDRLALPIQSGENTHGAFYLGWVLPYSVLAIVFAALLLPVAIRLQAVTRNRLIVAAAVYLGSALGLEFVESAVVDHAVHGAALATVDFTVVDRLPSMIFLDTVEEVGEMVGVALALRALLLHASDHLGVRLFALQGHDVARPAVRSVTTDPGGPGVNTDEGELPPARAGARA